MNHLDKNGKMTWWIADSYSDDGGIVIRGEYFGNAEEAGRVYMDETGEGDLMVVESKNENDCWLYRRECEDCNETFLSAEFKAVPFCDPCEARLHYEECENLRFLERQYIASR